MSSNLVSIIVPCCNEKEYIISFVHNVFTQSCIGFEIEIIIADGMSDDGTRDIVQALKCGDINLTVIDNEQKIVSAALNKALSLARGDIVVRMDVHTKYADNYVEQCVNQLRQTGATCVGGAWVASGNSTFQRSIAVAFQSPLGSGGAASRQRDYSGYVDTVYLGAWWRKDLVNLGGFDENLVRNQDDELCLRINRTGGKIWQSRDIVSEYSPRDSLSSLFRQFMQYGYWKVPVIMKHRLPASFRHFLPFVFYFLLLVNLILIPIYPPFAVIFYTMAVSYLLILYASLYLNQGVMTVGVCRWLVVAAMVTMHIGYAFGFARGILDFKFLGKYGSHSMSNLTR